MSEGGGWGWERKHVLILLDSRSLLNPAYGAIGPNSCVGMTGGWSLYGWPGALAMAGATGVWVMDLAAKRYVEKRYCVCGLEGEEDGADGTLDERTERRRKGGAERTRAEGDVGAASADESAVDVEAGSVRSSSSSRDRSSARKERLATVAFKQQLAAFLVLEFGILMHSVIIGMAMGAAGADEFPILYVVLLFHQSFEGLGIGARLSAIPMPARLGRWLPWALCGGYGVTTPVGIAVGLGLRHGYDAGGFAAQAVAGVLDAVSAGILLYNGLVELLARDFIFRPERTDDDWELAFMVGSVLVGAGIMALLGKWA